MITVPRGKSHFSVDLTQDKVAAEPEAILRGGSEPATVKQRPGMLNRWCESHSPRPGTGDGNRLPRSSHAGANVAPVHLGANDQSFMNRDWLTRRRFRRPQTHRPATPRNGHRDVMRFLRVALPVLLLAGCVHVPMQTYSRPLVQPMHGPIGRDFPQAAFSRFILDVTSLAEAEAALGPPAKTTKVQGLAPADARILAPGSAYSIISITYLYLPNGLGVPAQAHPIKAATLAFLNDRLVAYGADSTIAGGANTVVDESKLAALRQCQTTRGEAVALLGQPNGAMMHVLDAQTGAVELSYRWTTEEPGGTTRRNLRIVFDRNGVLSTYTLVNDQGSVPGLPMLPQAAPPATNAAPPLPACPAHGVREPT